MPFYPKIELVILRIIEVGYYKSWFVPKHRNLSSLVVSIFGVELVSTSTLWYIIFPIFTLQLFKIFVFNEFENGNGYSE